MVAVQLLSISLYLLFECSASGINVYIGSVLYKSLQLYTHFRRRRQLKKQSKAKAGNPDKNSNAPEVTSKPLIREKTPEERKKAHIQSIIKTAVAAFLGILAGFIAFFRLDAGLETKWYAILVIVAILAYYAQRIIYPAIKINTKEFGFKDWFYVEFIVIDFCLVTWTLLLN